MDLANAQRGWDVVFLILPLFIGVVQVMFLMFPITLQEQLGGV